MSTTPVYPARLGGTLAPGLSRWLPLVKWLLAIPHYVVLWFLWVAFFVVSVIAWFAILFTGRYPRALFDFNVGVLRWSWRVAFYSYGALGTDRYPPFTLAAVPDYPATLEIEYPERLSRGLALVKWWLLAIPHYLVVAVFVGAGAWAAWGGPSWRFVGGGGLIGLLVLVAAVILLFANRYPPAIFDFVLGLDRWVLRVAAYAGLMTDKYPPFRLDQGGDDPGLPAPAEMPEAPSAAAAEAPAARWTAGRVVLVVLSSLAVLVGTALLAAGIAAVVVDQTQRDEQGFLMSPTESFSSPTRAIVSETVDVSFEGNDWVAGSLLGTVKVESDATRPVFVGIGRADDVDSYLAGVEHAVVTEIGRHPSYLEQSGGAAATPPGEQKFWVASTTGSGAQALTWDAKSGNWRVVLMNVDGSAGVASEMAIGAELDPLIWIGIGVLVAGGMILVLSVLGLVFGVPREGR